jgi:hypothetical protein
MMVIFSAINQKDGKNIFLWRGGELRELFAPEWFEMEKWEI